MNWIDRLLDHITMYRLVLYYLIALLVIAFGLSVAGVLHYSPAAIVLSAGALTLICWLTNALFAWAFDAPAGNDSALITGLILALIITPTSSQHGLPFLVAAGVLAMASKYILAIRKKHIFNPAAIAVVITSFAAGQSASWWVGNAPMAAFVFIGGLLIVRKIERTQMVFTFLVVALATSTVLALTGHTSVITDLKELSLQSALLFMGFIMLTEPLTSPVTGRRRIWYAALAGLLFSPQIHLGSLYSTPELVLVLSNIFAYIISPKVKLLPRLSTKITTSPLAMDFVFTPERRFAYQPGQYMEWTLPHQGVDSRGNRRYLTLASSPTEPELRIGVKFYPKGSSFKRALAAIDPKTPIAAGQLGGDFTLPADRAQKLALIAGGIGITPFRSMLKYLTDTNDARSVHLLYAERSPSDFVYTDVFSAAAKHIGAKVTYVSENAASDSRWTGRTGRLSAEIIKAEVPDYLERHFYLSGPQPMVAAVKAALLSLGVKHSAIKTDFFPGYA